MKWNTNKIKSDVFNECISAVIRAIGWESKEDTADAHIQGRQKAGTETQQKYNF